ncbi:MAG: methyltransferase domain-containing protein [Alphaproteobacteria bacterium]|nr:methyltransferase domain-containing protein [Alphaproteobacteria bacterium]
MTPDDFDFVAELLKERSGLVLTRDKTYLVENRLMPVLRRRRLTGLEDLIGYLRDGDESLAREVVEAMMSGETTFFRDWKPFEHFRTVTLPNLLKARKDKESFRILCCGVSTGQEAYSLALLLREAGDVLAAWEPQIVGIDIADSAITRAQKGVYSQFEAQSGLPVRMLISGFEKISDSQWRIKDVLKAGIEFKRWNLTEELYPLGAFDVVLCRNVLMFFDQETKIKVLGRISRLLTDDGALYLGPDETTAGISKNFRAVAPEIGVFGVDRPDRPVSQSLAVGAWHGSSQSNAKESA